MYVSEQRQRSQDEILYTAVRQLNTVFAAGDFVLVLT